MTTLKILKEALVNTRNKVSLEEGSVSDAAHAATAEARAASKISTQLLSSDNHAHASGLHKVARDENFKAASAHQNEIFNSIKNGANSDSDIWVHHNRQIKVHLDNAVNHDFYMKSHLKKDFK